MRAAGIAADDPRVAECDDALAYLRLKSQLEQSISLVGPHLRNYMLAHSIDRMREKYTAALLREAGGS